MGCVLKYAINVINGMGQLYISNLRLLKSNLMVIRTGVYQPIRSFYNFRDNINIFYHRRKEFFGSR